MVTYSLQVAMAAEALLDRYEERVRKAEKMYPYLKAIEAGNALQQEEERKEAESSRPRKISVNWLFRRMAYQNR